MKLAKRLALTSAVVAVAAAGSVLATTADAAPVAHSSGHSTVKSVKVPAGLEVPAGNTLSGVFDASGVQTYACTDGVWKLLEPAATLFNKNDKRTVALHSRGPVWVSTVDGSAVNATAVATSPVTGSIPEVLLQASATRGSGVFGGVTYVQRLVTTGGVAPTAACTGTEQVGVPYTATYQFYKAAKK